MTKNFPNLAKEKTRKSRKIRFPNKMNPKRLTPRHIIIKILKIKNKKRISKSTRENQEVNYKEASIRLSSNLSTETFQARRNRHESYKVVKRKNLQTRLLYPARLSFKIDKEIKSFLDKDKKYLKEFINTKPVLHQMLKGLP